MLAGQDVYFHLNHPVKWVRVSGVVVAVDERETRHFYTIDDGSGATLECVVKVPPRPRPASGTSAPIAPANATSHADSNTLPTVDAPIDVGHILDIKGSVGTFREMKQIRAEKIAHLRSTEQEVVFWEKVTQLKRDVLSKPWVLDQREVRRCRKEEEGRSTSSRHRTNDKQTRKRLERKSGLETTKRARPEKSGLEKAKTPCVEETHARQGQRETKHSQERRPLMERPARQTGLEKRRATKPVTRLIPVTGKYDALGL